MSFCYSYSIKLFTDFCTRERALPFPTTRALLLDFINFSHFDRKHAASTTCALVSTIKKVNAFNGFDTSFFTDPIVRAVLKGVENKFSIEFVPKRPRLVMTYDALRLLGDLINNKSKWLMQDRLAVWGACLFSFWGTFRMGEIISDKANTPGFHCLQWHKISFPIDSDGLNVFIKAPKSSKDKRGSITWLAPFIDPRYCPVSIIAQLKGFTYRSPKSFIFQFSSGKLVSTPLIRKLLSELGRSLPDTGGYWGCHSFRAALPSLMTAHPNLFSTREIKLCGKWCSDAVDIYRRSKNTEAKEILAKVHATILKT